MHTPKCRLQVGHLGTAHTQKAQIRPTSPKRSEANLLLLSEDFTYTTGGICKISDTGKTIPSEMRAIPPKMINFARQHHFKRCDILL